MTARVHASLLLALAAAALVGCAGTSLETVWVPVDVDSWEGRDVPDAQGRHLAREWVPAGEAFDAWSERFVIEFLEGERTPPRDKMERMRTGLTDLCPHVVWEVVDEDSTSVLYEWRVRGCPGWPDQSEVARLLLGNDGLHRIAWATRERDVSEARRMRWVWSFKEAYVFKDGRPVVPEL